MNGHQLKYRTFNQLLEDVNVDFRTYALESMIEPQQLLKIARKVNYDLGLRINKTREVVLEIEKGRAKLPDDFYLMNYALLCGEYETTIVMPQGTHIEEVPCSLVPTYNPGPDPIEPGCEPVVPPCPVEVVVEPDSCCLENCGNNYKLIQKIKTQTRQYKFMYPIKLRKSQFLDCNCPNINIYDNNEAWITEGWIHTNFETANLYMNYVGDLEDEDGNILVLDHPMINEYYEYALKKKIYETLYFEGEDVAQKLQYVKEELRIARNNANSIVNTPNFKELATMWEKNRKAQYHKYYSMFKS